MKKYPKILFLIIFLIINNNMYSQENNFVDESIYCIGLGIDVSEDIELGIIGRGDSRNVYAEVKYSITGISNRTIAIRRYVDNGSYSNVYLNSKWKMGKVTGKEKQYEDGCYKLFRDHYYITMTVDRMTASVNATLGKHSFIQVITVEYLDI